MQWRYWSTLDNAEHQKKKKAAFLSYKEIAVAWVVVAALVRLSPSPFGECCLTSNCQSAFLCFKICSDSSSS